MNHELPREPGKVVMLLSNPYDPDDRVRHEALSLRRNGYAVTILAWDRDCQKREREEIDGIQVLRSHIRARYAQGERQIFRFVSLWRWFLKRQSVLRPALVHCHDLDTVLAGVWYRRRNQGVRVIFDAHECYHEMKRLGVSKPMAWLIRLAERGLASRADLLIAPCAATAEYYRRVGARRTVIVGNWKNPQDFIFPASELEHTRSVLGLNGKLVVVYIGSLGPDRIVAPLVDALRTRPHVFLILGGAGAQSEGLQAATRGLPNVFFPGFIHPDKVPLFTALADVVYYGFNPGHPSARYNAPNKLYEALAAGKALLAADIGGELTEVVRQVRAGVLVPRLDAASIGAALDCLADRTRLAEFQRRAQAASRGEYNWETCERNLMQAYDALQGRSGVNRPVR